MYLASMMFSLINDALGAWACNIERRIPISATHIGADELGLSGRPASLLTVCPYTLWRLTQKITTCEILSIAESAIYQSNKDGCRVNPCPNA